MPAQRHAIAAQLHADVAAARAELAPGALGGREEARDEVDVAVLAAARAGRPRPRAWDATRGSPCATIAGSVTGARLGLAATPAHWRRDVEDSAYLHALGAHNLG